MSELGTRMAAMRAALADRFPRRKVRSSFVDFNSLESEHLAAGVYTLVSVGEDEFTNVSGYIAKDGDQDIAFYGQIQLPEQKNKNTAGEAIQEAEFVMIEELKDFLRNLPESLCQMSLMAWRQSQQLEEPYGWVMASLRYES